MPIPVLWALDVMKLDDATSVICPACFPNIRVGGINCLVCLTGIGDSGTTSLACLTNTGVGGMIIGVRGRFWGLGFSFSFPLIFLTPSSSFHLFANEVLIDPAIPCGVGSLLTYVSCTLLIGQSSTSLMHDDAFILDIFFIISSCPLSMTYVFSLSFLFLSSSLIVSLATLTRVFLLLPFFFR